MRDFQGARLLAQVVPDFNQHQRKIDHRIASQRGRRQQPRFIVKVVREVLSLLWVVWCVVPAQDRLAMAEQLIRITSAMTIMVEPNLKRQLRGHRGTELHPKSSLTVGDQFDDLRAMNDLGLSEQALDVI